MRINSSTMGIAGLLVTLSSSLYTMMAWGEQMAQEPKIVHQTTKLLVGLSKDMSRMDDKTPELWRSFMPRRGEVTNRLRQEFVSMQVYPEGPQQLANPTARFTKWAVVEVEDFISVPAGMDTYTLQGGTYAVFVHNGPASDTSTVMYIFTDWLPNSSEYAIDDREHFELLPADYRATDPNAREEFWIPVRPRAQD